MGCAGKVGSAPSDPDGGGNVVLPECTPSVLEYIQDFVPSASLTVSINDGERVTVQTPPLTATEAEFFQHQLQLINLMTAGDGESIAFLSAFFTSLGTQPPSETQQGQVATQISGISSTGDISVYGTTHNVADLIVDAALDGVTPAKHSVSSIKNEETTIKIYPTNGVARAADDYYRMPGSNDNGDPVVLASCARAVLEPFVCTPTTPMPVNLDMPSGTTNVYAKYRINGGEWLTYTNAAAEGDTLDLHLTRIRHPNPPTQNLFAQADRVNKNVLNSFLFNDYKDSNGFQWGDSGGNWGDPDYNEDIQFPLPFHIINYEGVDTIFSGTATDTAPDSYPSMQALDTTPTTIEFVTSAGTGLDLVAHVFGGDVALSACGYGNWSGV